MKRWEELSRVEMAVRCVAVVVVLLFFVVVGHSGLSILWFCSQREWDIEYLEARDAHVWFAYFFTPEGRIDLDAPLHGPKLLNGTRLFYYFNEVPEIRTPIRPLSDQEVRELTPILGRFRGLKKIGILWNSPVEPQTILDLKKALPPGCKLLKLDGTDNEW